MHRHENLSSESFEAELLADLLGVAPDVQALREWWGADEPGLHIVVGDVLAPQIIRAAESGDDASLQSLCVFMERMATSSDERVRNALTVSLLERLGDDRERLDRARTAMGPKTLALSREIEGFWGRES